MANTQGPEDGLHQSAAGENYAVPVRPGIVATYTEHDLGYLIEQTEDGFRYIGVELGDLVDFGPFVASKKAALQGAVADWRAVGQGDSWAAWSRQMAKDAVAPDAREVDAKKIEEFLIGSAAGAALTEAEITALAEGLSAHLSSGE